MGIFIKLSRFILVFALFFFFAAKSWSAAAQTKSELEYLELKASGLHDDAMEFLYVWSMTLSDSVLLEINLFRINELIRYPEQFERALAIFNKLQQHETFKQNPPLLQRLCFFKLELLFRMNRIKEASELKQSLNFLDFQIIGPFNSENINDFDIKRSLPNLNSNAELPGKNYPVSWFRSYTDMTGVTDINELLPDSDTANSLFYLCSEVELKQGGIYKFSVGKTGSCEMSIDGTMVFQGTERHDFYHGQYIIEAAIPAGKHIILFKLDSSATGAVLSCAMNIVSANDSVGEISSVAAKRFNALEESAQNKSDASLFRTGYLLYESGLSQDGRNETLQACSAINESSRYYPFAQYYSAMSFDDYESEDICLQKAIASYPLYGEAIFASAMINIECGFFYKVWPLLEDLQNKDKSRILYLQALCNFYFNMEWPYEVLKTTELFLKTKKKSLFLYYTAAAHIQNRHYDKAAALLETVCAIDPDNYNTFDKLQTALEQSGKIKQYIALLDKTTVREPNNINLLLLLAEQVEKNQSAENAIPYISAALKRSPQNSKALYNLAMIYHKLGRANLAAHYMAESLKRDPANYDLKQYLDFLQTKEGFFEKQKWNGNIEELEALADAGKDQKAVRLLNEQLFRINPDGSYEKSIRIIVKIYDETAVEDFSSQYIVYEPGIDSIENIRCRVINDGSAVEITERYIRELSDPESRLYYNLEAVMIPVSSLRRGSILDFSYTIKNKGAAEYRNVFSETLYVGSAYSIILFNAALSHPQNRPVFVFMKDISPSIMKKEVRDGNIFYKAELNNIIPYKNETAMPPLADILPAIYFTSHKDWDALVSWYQSLLKNKIVMSDEMKNDLNSIISPNDSDQEKVRKIYNHVTDSIRYVGFELGVGAFQPRPSDKTYSTRMGDCKDIAIVLAAFLREAGIDASPALVNTRDRGQININAPTIGAFNHAICYTAINGGIFLDGTRDNTSYLELSGTERDVYALVISENDYRFVKTENPNYANNIDKAKIDVFLKADGSAELRQIIEKYGDTAANTRDSLYDLDKTEKSLTEYWNKIFPDARITDLKVIESSRDKPVKYSYNVQIKNFASLVEDEIVFNPFFLQSQYYRIYAMNTNRNFPLTTAYFSTLLELVFHLPDGYAPANLPEDKSIKHPLFESAYAYKYSEKTIRINFEFKIKAYSIEPKHYAAFRTTARFIQKEESKKIILRKE